MSILKIVVLSLLMLSACQRKPAPAAVPVPARPAHSLPQVVIREAPHDCVIPEAFTRAVQNFQNFGDATTVHDTDAQRDRLAWEVILRLDDARDPFIHSDDRLTDPVRACLRTLAQAAVPAARFIGDRALQGVGPNCNGRQMRAAIQAAHILRNSLPDPPDSATMNSSDALLVVDITLYAIFCVDKFSEQRDSMYQWGMDEAEFLELFAEEYGGFRCLGASPTNRYECLRKPRETFNRLVHRAFMHENGYGASAPFMSEVCRRLNIHPEKQIVELDNPELRQILRTYPCTGGQTTYYY